MVTIAVLALGSRLADAAGDPQLLSGAVMLAMGSIVLRPGWLLWRYALRYSS
jgi:hypothetical protein